MSEKFNVDKCIFLIGGNRCSRYTSYQDGLAKCVSKQKNIECDYQIILKCQKTSNKLLEENTLLYIENKELENKITLLTNKK